MHRLHTIILLLAIGVLVIGGLAWGLYHPETTNPTPAPATPMHGVYAGKSGQAAIDAARAHASNTEQATIAYGGTTDGKAIYGHLCHVCHTPGIAGAPRLGDTSAWAPRIAQGMDTLVKHAMNGYTGPDGNRMPAKGGNPELSRQQIANTVKWMVKQSR